MTRRALVFKDRLDEALAANRELVDLVVKLNGEIRNLEDKLAKTSKDLGS